MAAAAKETAVGEVTLDDIREDAPERGKCRYCGEDATAHTEIRIRERGGSKKQIRSMSVSACDRHTVALFQDVVKTIEKKRA